MVSFHQAAELAYFVHKEDGETAVEALATSLRLTSRQIAEVIGAAVELEIVRREDARVLLTPKGRMLGAAIERHLTNLEGIASHGFQPYTTYVPERWWP